MTEANNLRFDVEAAQWDANPDVHRASDEALKAIIKAYPEMVRVKDDDKVAQLGYDVLEIGCGTGLLSFRLAPYVKSILAVDASHGMISALQQKLEKQGEAPTNVSPLEIMLVDPEDPCLPSSGDASGSESRKKFDLVISHLVLHHIPDLASLLKTMHGCLKPGGTIALTDFEDEGPHSRKFHPEAKMSGVERHGINRADFANLMTDAGFAEVHIETGWTMRKEVERFPGEWGHKKPTDQELEWQDFPFLLCMGKK